MDILEEHLTGVVNKTWNFAGTLQEPRDHVLNAVMGLAGETGEVLDLHKKLFFHQSRKSDSPEFREELKLELGNLTYYFLKTLDVYGFTIEEVLAGNKHKLGLRYPGLIEGY